MRMEGASPYCHLALGWRPRGGGENDIFEWVAQDLAKSERLPATPTGLTMLSPVRQPQICSNRYRTLISYLSSCITELQCVQSRNARRGRSFMWWT